MLLITACCPILSTCRVLYWQYLHRSGHDMMTPPPVASSCGMQVGASGSAGVPLRLCNRASQLAP
jgi:hypothetical protein